MTHKHGDKLARRVQRLEDRHRRDMIALRRETLAAILAFSALPLQEPVASVTREQIADRLNGRKDA